MATVTMTVTPTAMVMAAVQAQLSGHCGIGSATMKPLRARSVSVQDSAFRSGIIAEMTIVTSVK
jgi:hypothetical protein